MEEKKEGAEQAVESNASAQKKANWQTDVLSYLHDLVFIVAIVMLLFLLLFRVVIVSGTSMYDTLWDGDYLLLISNSLYHTPQYGDIIVAAKQSFQNGDPIVKRVIAVEGQTVDIDFEKGIVYVDGNALDEPYTHTLTNLDEGTAFPLTVDDGCVFVMGDNRNKSKDSRSTEIGLVDKREILGRAVFLMFPGTNEGKEARDLSRVGGLS